MKPVVSKGRRSQRAEKGHQGGGVIQGVLTARSQTAGQEETGCGMGGVAVENRPERRI